MSFGVKRGMRGPVCLGGTPVPSFVPPVSHAETLDPGRAIRAPDHTPQAVIVALNRLSGLVCDVVPSGATMTPGNGRGMIVNGDGGGPAPTNRQLWMLAAMIVGVVIYCWWVLATGDATPWN